MATRFGLGQLAASLRGICNAAASGDALLKLAQTSGLPPATLMEMPRALTSLLRFSAAAPSGLPRSTTSRSFSTASSEGSMTAESLDEIRARIFGTHIGNGLRSGRKVLRKPLLGDKIASYYPDSIIKVDPLMIDLKAERAKLKLDRLKRRGKAPPKKGAGKRAGKK